MSTPGAKGPRQFKASIGQSGRRRQHPQTRGRGKRPEQEEEPIEAKLLETPRPKAVAPYTPGTELEDSHLRHLIHYYVTFVTAKTVTNVGPRFEWYPLAVRDEAFFHAVISSTCAHISYLTGLDLPYRWIFLAHRFRAIRLVNERLARGAHDEGTINAIVVFAQQESFEAHGQLAKTHIDGLVQIVRAAGGPQSPELSEKTRRHLLFVDLAASITLNSKPLFPSTLDLTDLETYFRPASGATLSYAKTFGDRLYNYTGSPLSDLVANVWWGLRNISELLEAIKDQREIADTLCPSDIQFSDRVEVLERLVHRLWFVEDPSAPQHPLFQTFGSTCLIYIYSKFRELPVELGMNVMLANRVRIALETCRELNVLLATFPDLLLWEMFICGKIADPRDKPFLAKQATKILMVKKLDEAGGILAAADKFLWPERGSGSPLARAGPYHLASEMETMDT